MIKNIIFDLDGTLWDTTEIVAMAWNKAISQIGNINTVVTASILKKEFGKPMNVIADNLFPELSDKEALLELCCQYEHDALLNNKKNLMYKDVKETLVALAKAHSLFIASNCQSGYIELFMEKADIQEYILDTECFGDTRMSKGENIKLLMKRNGLEDGVYVGDTQGDYEATVFAQVPFVFAKYGFGNPENYDYAINEFKELLALNAL